MSLLLQLLYDSSILSNSHVDLTSSAIVTERRLAQQIRKDVHRTPLGTALSEEERERRADSLRKARYTV